MLDVPIESIQLLAVEYTKNGCDEHVIVYNVSASGRRRRWFPMIG